MERLRTRRKPASLKAADNPNAHSLYFSSAALARAAEKLAKQCLRPSGLSPSMAQIIHHLTWETTVGPSYLAQMLLLSPSTMTRLLNKLEKKGLIERFEYDAMKLIRLTPKGWEIEPLLARCENAFYEKYTGLLGDTHALTDQMNQATDILRAALEGPGKCRGKDKDSNPKTRSLLLKGQFMGSPETNPKIEAAYLQKSISYDAYTALIDQLVTNGQTTGPEQSEAFVHYTILNQQRMHRWEKTIQLLPSAETAIRSITLPQTWLVLTEAWCGDAAHSIPVLHALAMLNPLITLRFLMRDENPDLMDRYLTNGISRSIPKLIAVDTVTAEELFTWGPRPAPLQAMFMKLREEGTPYAAIKEELQRWYNKDKTITIQQEMAALAAAAGNMGLTA